MTNQYTFEFPTLERLWAFKLAIDPQAYVIEVSSKSIKCSCSDLEVRNAIANYSARLTKTAIGKKEFAAFL